VAVLVPLEKHFRVKELAALWGLSDSTIIKLFTDEPGVLRVTTPGTGKRRYAVLSIPESIALRVHERFSNERLQPILTSARPLRVIKLSDFNAAVSKKPRNVVKLKAA
jgi:hypothetical protein